MGVFDQCVVIITYFVNTFSHQIVSSALIVVIQVADLDPLVMLFNKLVFFVGDRYAQVRGQ
jgi:hypothetical protein